MTGVKFAVLFCVLLLQRVTAQTCNCQSELFISIDDLMKALNNGPGCPGQPEPKQNQCCQPSCQPTCQPSCQPSCQQSQQCGQTKALAIGQPTFSISGLSLGNQCGCGQPIQSCQQCGQQNLISNPSISFQPVSVGQKCQPQKPQQVKQAEIPSCIVPAALLQAPPYGIIFAGDNLLIDGAVQVCGNMPFNSIIELGGIVPSSGSGSVQYSCGDSCSLC